jgi:hypothetical protein
MLVSAHVKIPTGMTQCHFTAPTLTAVSMQPKRSSLVLARAMTNAVTAQRRSATEIGGQRECEYIQRHMR